MRHIWLIRHGKSAEGRQDHERALNKRGRADGELMQAWFARHAHPARWVWTSSAQRARETAQFVTAGFEAEEAVVDSLYLAGTNALLDCLRATPADVTAVAIVAHNPGLTYLTNALSPKHVTDNLVTFGCARFVYQGEWSDLALGQAQFQALDTPKTIR